MNIGATTAVTTAVNATIIAVIQAQRRKVLAHFNDQQALSPEQAVPTAGLEPALHSTLTQLRAQGIIKDVEDGRAYLDADALLTYEKKTAKDGRTALMVMVPIFVAIAVAIVVAVALSR
ncbi:hypothetical protein [Stenotrophomonas sp. NPDC077461]|uniref:hypothetical protein n=1 Tax=Stenotrophomonas sp. NPDC077461 TaxID=3414698 RepID=UPI003C2CACA1